MYDDHQQNITIFSTKTQIRLKKMNDWRCNNCIFVASKFKSWSKHVKFCREIYDAIATIQSRKKMLKFTKKSIVFASMLKQFQKLTRKQISKNTNENQISTNVNNVSKLYENNHETKNRWNKTIIYEKIINKKIEISYVNIDIIQKFRNFNEHYVVIHHFFQIEIDFVFAKYLFNIRVTKKIVNNFFDDFKLKFLWQHIFFKNNEKWLNKFERMKIEIFDDE